MPQGYEGNLCGSCAKGYGTASTVLSCRKCHTPRDMGLITAFSAVALLAAMHLSVHAALRSRYEAAVTLGAPDLIKILVRHLQQLLLLMEVHMLWPSAMVNATKWISWVLRPGTSVAALECVFDMDRGTLAAGRLIFWLVLPVVTFFILMGLQLLERELRRVLRRRPATAAREGTVAFMSRSWIVTAMTTAFFFYP